MKENIDIHYVFNLVDSNGTKLQLRLGRLKGYGDELLAYHCDQGFRWSFVGSKIPMPIRACTWFNGFPENIMLDWLKGNGWAIRSRVEMSTGKATIYKLPFVDEPSKGDEKSSICDGVNKAAFEATIREYVLAGNILMAVRLFRYVHGGSLADARDKVREIASH